MDQEQRRQAIEGMVAIHPAEDEHGMGFVCQIGSAECIITAAHCLPRLVDPRIATGDPLTVQVSKLNDDQIRAEVLPRFVDPCADSAILCDSNWHCDLFDLPNGNEKEAAFSSLLSKRRKLTICTELPSFGEKITLHIYTVGGEWVTGTATLTNRYSPRIGFNGRGNVAPSTSGAPVFTDEGDVIGVVSAGTAEEMNAAVQVVLLGSALPRWAIMALDEDGKGHLPELPSEIRDQLASIAQINPAAQIRECMEQSGANAEAVAEQLGMSLEELRLLLEPEED